MARTTAKPTVHVILDTNCLFTQAADYLIHQEVADLIDASRQLGGVSVQWHIPTIVMEERRGQMIRRGAELLPSLGKLERLLGHKLGITGEIIEQRVEAAINKHLANYGIDVLDFDDAAVSWRKLIHHATRRKPPFDPGEKSEKGFRDAIIIETLFQFAASQAKSPASCRVVVVSSDSLFSAACAERQSSGAAVTVLGNMGDLRTLLNTLASEVEEKFIKDLIPKAALAFYSASEKSLFNRDGLAKIAGNFLDENKDPKSDQGDKWEVKSVEIAPPSFLEKKGQRIKWMSKFTLKVETKRKAGYTGLVSIMAQGNNPSALGIPASQLFMSPGQSPHPTGLLSGHIAPTALGAATQEFEYPGVGHFVIEFTWGLTLTTAGTFKKVELLNTVLAEAAWS